MLYSGPDAAAEVTRNILDDHNANQFSQHFVFFWEKHTMANFVIRRTRGTLNPPLAITYKCGLVVLFHTPVYFAISKLIPLFSYSFPVLCIIILSKVYFYIVSSMFLFLFNWSQWQASIFNQISHLFFGTQKYFFALFNFLKMVIFTTLFRRYSRLWNRTLKITALFRRCLTLLISTFK